MDTAKDAPPANNSDSTRSQTFAYDGLNRLLTAQTVNTSSANCWDLAFDYDIWGNLTNQDVVGSGPCYASGFSIGVDGNNHVMGFGYEAAGNVTSDGHNTYAWNGAGELKTAAVVTYTYAGSGQRVEKSSGTLYWYGQGGEVLDESDASGNITNEYVYFAGKRIAWRDSSNNIHYYAEDFLGSSRVITTSAGAVCYDADFYPFGGERTFTNTCSQNYKFTGKERDAETGNDYFGARFYSSSFGRFISPDWSVKVEPVPYAKLDYPQSLNLYTYVGNNPESVFDPDGHAQQQAAVSTQEVATAECDWLTCPRKAVVVVAQRIKAAIQNAALIGQQHNRLKQGLKGGGETVLGVGLIATVAGGDVPGGVVGAVLVASGGITGAALTVKGTGDVIGASTKTDVSKADEALEATGNLGGLVAAAASGGNLKAGQTAATITSLGALAANPMEATRNIATAVEAGRTSFSAIDLARSIVSAVHARIGQVPWPLFF